ncbi:hypothetical protein KSP39_PZI004460 [Platanthera zijinensis]|uniref:HpcH/HpaI aldolase/citrate lyase domain-containing protein n=1 Tax=Platanthera zijinensis TaxID=2320716 RepID=A0AAP0BW73_9ASPA
MATMATIASSPSMAALAKSSSISPKFPNLQNPNPLPFPNANNENPKSISIFHPLRRSPAITKSSSSLPDPIAFPLPSKSLSLKSRLAAGETLYGLFLLSASPILAEIAGFAGYDYVVVDMEHGPGGISDALPCLHALASTGTAAVLRLPETSAASAKKALDLGPQGIMFPMIDDARSAQLAVSFCRFPPRGVRGSAHTIVRASAYGIDDGYLARCEEELLLMCQIESATAADNIEAIAAVDGVNCLQMGPLDLSASMGYLWNPGDRKVREKLREVERRVLALRKENAETAKDSPPYLSGFSMPFERPEDLKMRGYHMVAGAVDVGMFRKAAVEDVLSFRRAETEIREEDGVNLEDGDRSYWSE